MNNSITARYYEHYCRDNSRKIKYHHGVSFDYGANTGSNLMKRLAALVSIKAL